MIKSLTGREVFHQCPQVKKQLWGGELWTDGYYASTVGKHGNEEVIGRYVKEQDGKYQKLYSDYPVVAVLTREEKIPRCLRRGFFIPIGRSFRILKRFATLG